MTQILLVSFPELLVKCIFEKIDGYKKEIVANMVLKNIGKKPKRKLGILEGKRKIKFGKDFKITKEEFLGK